MPAAHLSRWIYCLVALFGLTSLSQAKDPPLDVLFINLNEKGHVILERGADPLKTSAEIARYLRRQYKRAEKEAQDKGQKTVNTVVVIRGPKTVDFSHVFVVMRETKLAGFRQWQLRVRGEEQPNQPAPAPKDTEKPKAEEKELKSEVTVKVMRRKEDKADFSAIIVQSEEGEQSVADLKALTPFLKAKRGDLKNKQDLQIQADSKVAYGTVLDFMRAGLEAGFVRIGFAPPPDLLP